MVELLNRDGLVPTFLVLHHQARPKAVGPPGNHGVIGLFSYAWELHRLAALHSTSVGRRNQDGW